MSKLFLRVINPFTNEDGVSTEKEDSSTTVEEVPFQTLSSIACIGRSFCDGDNEPESVGSTRERISGHFQSKAIFVGTHLDLVTEDEFKEKDRLLQQRIMSTEFYDKNIIEFASEDQLMLAVDNMTGDQKEIDRIRAILERIIARNFAKIDIPAAWFMLSLCLRKTGARTMSLRECERVAGKLGISPTELQDALWFLHHYIGVLLYYPEIASLKATVICDIQIVFDSASNLINNTFTFDKVDHKSFWDFKEKAQFTLEDIKRATRDHTSDLIPLEKLVDLLEDRNVLTVIPEPSTSEVAAAREPTYFMPCVLKSARADELIVNECRDSDPPSLMLRYECGYFPIGVFPAMITNLVSQKDWHMIDEGLRKNRVQFYVGGDYDTVTLILHPRFLKVAVSRRESFLTPTESLCAHVRSVIQSTLATVTSHLNYHFRMQYQFGFECPCPIHPKQWQHICVLAKESASLMECLQDPRKKQLVPLESHHMVWFQGKIKLPSTATSHQSVAGGSPPMSKLEQDCRSDMLSYERSAQVQETCPPCSGEPHPPEGKELHPCSESMIKLQQEWQSDKLSYEPPTQLEELHPPRSEEPRSKKSAPVYAGSALHSTRVSESEFGSIWEKLSQHSPAWKDIGTRLGFTPAELSMIEHTPTLLMGAPSSYLRTMLSSWLQWAPGDARGSKDYATLEALSAAVDKAGFGRTAFSLIADFFH